MPAISAYSAIFLPPSAAT